MYGTIYDTATGKVTASTDQLKLLVKFLSENYYQLTLPPDVASRVFNTRMSAQTSLTRIIDRLVAVKKESLFNVYAVPKQFRVSTPEIAQYSHITFDVKQMPPSLQLQLSMSPFNNKIVTNISPWLTRNGDISDTSYVHSMLVRDVLSRSYYNASGSPWMFSATLRFLAKFYTMALSGAVSSAFNLTDFEQTSVSIITAYYFLRMTLESKSDAATMLKTNLKYLRLGGSELAVSDGINFADRIFDAGNTGRVEFTQYCDILNGLPINRLKLDRRWFISRASHWGPDIHTSAMALEYPPYWAYLMIMAASGHKIGLARTMDKISSRKEIEAELVDGLLRSPNFFTNL